MIQPGQTYRSLDPRGGPRIRIASYRHGEARACVVDADTSKRYRHILVSQLHDSDRTKTGAPRRTGYALEAASARHSAPRAPDGHAETADGGNGPQTGAQGSALREQIAAAVQAVQDGQAAPVEVGDERIVDAALAVVQAALREQRDRQAEQTVDLIQRNADLQITLREVLAAYDATGCLGATKRQQWTAVLDQPEVTP